MASSFNNAHHFVIENSVINNTVIHSGHPHKSSGLKELHSLIAPGAIHDSSERCDAPKCHPETRVAVQDELFSRIVRGDEDPQPKKIKWITGPAGSGKAAVMGSLAQKCSDEGLLAASFFFSSFSPAYSCRTKTALLWTLTYQLAQHHPDLKSVINRVVEERPEVFTKSLPAQMKMLLLEPLREVKMQGSPAVLIKQKVIIIDGVDECEAKGIVIPDGFDEMDPKFRNPAGNTSSEYGLQEQSNEEDQLDILQVLLHASLDDYFPFRIIIASRPERVFRLFFETGPFAPILTLDEKYNPDADITLYLEAKFAEIRRKYKLSSSWPPAHTVPTLVKNASSQFIYAATVIRFITESRKHNPYTLIDIVLDAKPTELHPALNPFANLDALYFRILQSSPNPELTVRWIWVIHGVLCPMSYHLAVQPVSIYTGLSSRPPARFLNRRLETFDGEAEHLLGDLHSLVKVPSSSNEFEAP